MIDFLNDPLFGFCDGGSRAACKFVAFFFFYGHLFGRRRERKRANRKENFMRVGLTIEWLYEDVNFFSAVFLDKSFPLLSNCRPGFSIRSRRIIICDLRLAKFCHLSLIIIVEVTKDTSQSLLR